MFTFRDFAFTALGISLGAVVTFRKLEQLHQAELDDILKELNSLLAEQQDAEEEEETEEKTIEEERMEEKYEEKVSKNNYLSLIRENNYKDEAQNDIVAGGPREDDYHMEEERTQPYVVSLEDFINNRTEYDTVTITYYEGDDTLADENEDILVEVEEVVGRASLLEFGNMSEDPDVVYVRNDMLAMHYEIVRDERTYQEAVLGEV